MVTALKTERWKNVSESYTLCKYYILQMGVGIYYEIKVKRCRNDIIS